MSNEAIPRRPHGNSGLFSDHYLNITLPEIDGWHELAIEAASVIEKISEVFYSYSPGNEAQTEETLIRPILRALGHTFEVQVSLGTSEGIKVPDYVLYRDEAALAQNRERTLTEKDFVGRAIAIGEAKAWDRPLSDSLKGGSKNFDNRNPSFQISFYMLHSGTEWGILTNGRLWRLYHRDSAHRLDRFYEIDLPEILKTGDAQTFLYFYAFFRRAAFDDAPLTVGAFLTGSAEYARNIEESLRLQVYDALRHIAQGFLDYPKNGLAREPEDLRKVYDASLILLYRILFVLYAEARELLPVNRNSAYRDEYSISGIKREVAERLDSGAMIPAGRKGFWNRLEDLFDAISDGDDVLGIPTYNGGLFDDSKHPFLAEKVVGDRHLQRALDRLARVNGQFVDYRDLSERHLGTIYEGLLEYHLEATDESDESGDEAEGWTIALRNSEGGERHDTGSYYTPDFIVKHIVERTVGPALEAAVATCETDEERIEAVLALNVLDPAMGSGHFLVEVTEYIARFLVGIGVLEEDEGDDSDQDAELARWKRRVVQSCVYGVDLNPLAVELAKLSLWLSTVAEDRPLSFLDHHLRCGNSLVGAAIPDPRPRGKGWDAKKSARKKKAKSPNDGQLSMMDDDAFRQSMSAAVGSMWEIEESPAESADEVKEQERLYAALRKDLDARLANLATAASGFGVAADPALWNAVTEYATKNTAAALPQFERWLMEADEVAEEQRFFHWELEFPEVFFDREGAPLGGDAGFDAVVGNPPYVRQEVFSGSKPYFRVAYPETFHGVADLYVYFYQLGLEKLSSGARLGFIVTNKWLKAGYGEPLRGYFAERGTVEEILDFGHAPIFADADVFPCIVTLRNHPNVEGSSAAANEPEVLVTSFPRASLGVAELDDFIRENGHRVPRRRFTNAAWSLETADVDDLMAKLRGRGIPLAEFAGVKPVAGIKTSLNEAFLIDTQTKERLVREDGRSEEVIKPYLRGQDVKRWSPDWRDLWMIVLKSSGDFAWSWSDSTGDEAERIFRETYPALHAHLKPLEARLRKRSDKGRNWWELRSCAYYNVFESPAIFYQDLAYHSRFCFGSPGSVAEMTCFALPSNNSWLLAVLNSPLMWTYMWRNVVHGKDEVLRLKTVYTEKLHIAEPKSEAAREEAESAVGRLVGITTEEQRSVRDMLDWLRLEFGVEKPGQKLQDFAALDSDTFVTEVRKRLPKEKGRGAARLSLATLRDLRDAYEESAAPVKAARIEAAKLERRISSLVNEAYDLSAEESELLKSTAPTRTPPFLP